MKLATISDLQNESDRAARWGEEGERVEITRSGKSFAQIAPVSGNVLMPDFLARMRENFPDEVFRGDLVSVIDHDRGDR